ncbi:MAG: rhomboid family intramembrane serine protease [Chloroflexi bacterium]|nr:rhomboid family intramembrane serine protease [Chloroflexota bacterium]
MIPLSDPDLHNRRRPIVNIALIVLNAMVFVYTLSLGSDRTLFFYTYGLIPQELTTGKEITRLFTGRSLVDVATALPTWATLFTSMFIHGGLVHFLSNMLYLWIFGDNVEGRMGHMVYLLFYAASGVAAAGTQVLIDPGSQLPMVGASGAIAGVLGAYLFFFPKSRIRTLLWFYVVTVVRVPAVFLLGFWIVLQFWEGLGALGLSAQDGGTAYWAHIGGFAVGALAVVFYRLVRRQPVWHRNRGLGG